MDAKEPSAHHDDNVQVAVKLMTDPHGDLLQDALGVLHFPKVQTDELGPFYDAKVHEHLVHWGKKQLPIPEGGSQSEDEFQSCCKRMALLIQDYIEKAISPDLAKAYTHLPLWTHPSLTADDLPGFQDIPPRPNPSPISFHALSEREQHRLCKAFLRFEITARFFRQASSNVTEGYHTNLFSDVKQPERLPPWSWNVLDRYECKRSAPWEIESLKCVAEYVCCLMGAALGRMSGIDDHNPQGSSCEPSGWSPRCPQLGESLFSSTSSDSVNNDFRPDCYLDVTTRIRVSWDNFVTMVGLWGLDQITFLLQSCTEFRDRYFEQATTNAVARRRRFWRIMDFIPPSLLGNKDDNDAVNLVWLKTDPKRIAGIYHDKRQSREFYPSFLGICRQRAWTFFDDERWYPAGCRLPIPSDIEEASVREKALRKKLEEIRQRRMARERREREEKFGREWWHELDFTW
ncbi:hypothetical protein HIM_09464 [Hirsutella minnesotensis 3608]|uniref:Uncharacterized protein n=1 Tax=Hirsutella minnesotensis 3608 TaxID=1043627 RepID=A0A0F7ZLJ0_9HYPO|nr:hypothetical protein HIM_09464 [Hirsutella minnesotensis 3608]